MTGPAGSPRPLVVSVGNRFMGDDGVGPAALDALDADPELTGVADLVELDGEPARLIDAWSGRDLAVVLDAVRFPGREPGAVVDIEVGGDTDPESVARWDAGVSGHSAGLADAVRLAQVLDRLPARLVVVGVAVGRLAEGPSLSGPVAAAVGEVAERVRALVAPAPGGSGTARGAEEVTDVPG